MFVCACVFEIVGCCKRALGGGRAKLSGVNNEKINDVMHAHLFII